MNTESNKFRITTLTPIAISSGEQIDSFEYLIQGNYFYRLKTDEILSYVIKEVPQSINKISEWIETKDEKLNNQSSSNLKKKGTYKLNIFDFISNHLNRKDLEHTIRQKIKEGKFIRYKMPTNEPNVSKLVNSHIKTADNKIYIPGTTIKGIIRTAILNEYFYKVFTDKEFASEKIEILDKLKSELRECKSQDNKKKKDAKNFFEDEINEIFNYSTKEYDAKYDLMKFVRVSDTNCRLPEEVCELVLPKTLTAKGTAQGQLNALEVIKKGVSFDFTIDFDIEFLRAVEKSIDNKQERDMFYSKLENLFGISKKNMNELSNSLIVEMFSENIMDYLYNYLVGIEKLDVGFYDRYPKNSKKLIFPKIGDKDIATKIGWGGGFHSKTVLFNILDEISQNNGEIKKIYEEIFDLFRIGQTPGKNAKPKKVDLHKFPTSRKVSEINNYYEHLGWIKIEQLW